MKYNEALFYQQQLLLQSEDTADQGAKTDGDVTSEHDVSYYRRLIISETERLTTECGKWDEIDSSTDNLSDDGESWH